jgi:amino acid permease
MVHFLSNTLLGGIIWLIVGVYFIRYMKKYEAKDYEWKSPLQPYLTGWVVATCFIGIGIAVVIRSLFFHQ